MDNDDTKSDGSVYRTPPTEESRYRDVPGLRRVSRRNAGGTVFHKNLLAWLTVLAILALIVVVLIAVRWGVSTVR